MFVTGSDLVVVIVIEGVLVADGDFELSVHVASNPTLGLDRQRHAGMEQPQGK